MEREFVKNRLASQFYKILCEYKGWDDKKKFIDPPCYAYADFVIDLFGIDDDVIERLTDLGRMFDGVE